MFFYLLPALSEFKMHVNMIKWKYNMCNPDRPSVKAVLDNLKVTMSFKKKLFLFIKNSSLRVIKLQNCCGHLGEPGC